MPYQFVQRTTCHGLMKWLALSGFLVCGDGCVMNLGEWSAVCGEGGGRGVRRGRVLVQYGYEVGQWVAHISYICSNVGGEF